MPVRPAPLLRRVTVQPQPCLVASRRAFASTSRSHPDDHHHHHHHFSKKNHYERLNVHHEASPSEIKKSFYKLSKAHHPDANPHDPNASHTFSLLSESYTLLSDATRRTAYDRDVLRLHLRAHPHPGTAHQPPRGSYHSAGGRPASGLSRRRGTFRGPPPSFYRAGGYGAHEEKRRRAHEEKRRRAHEESTAGGGTASESSSQQGGGAGAGGRPGSESSAHGGMGPGGDPFGHQDDVPHFDRQGHHRTQRREDERRWQRTHRTRRAVDDDNVEFEPQMSLGAHFMIVMGILATSFAVPALYLRFARSGRKKKREAHG